MLDSEALSEERLQAEAEAKARRLIGRLRLATLVLFVASLLV